MLKLEEEFQEEILKKVSRTFALTIPQLPESLSKAVANAYLLCRIADTIEDDTNLTLDEKKYFSNLLIEILEKKNLNFAELEQNLKTKLGETITTSEKKLIENSESVITITHSLSLPMQKAMITCVKNMTKGMVKYQGKETLDGLKNQSATDDYCYFVAGVVGEMLTEIFTDYGQQWEQSKKNILKEHAVSFGQGLQMTNILKDIWADRARGACWLPKDLFDKEDIELRKMMNGKYRGFEKCLNILIGRTLFHLNNALKYSLAIPKQEKGIRIFCLWALFMAAFTLRKIHKNQIFLEGIEVKISRRSVFLTAWITKILVKSNFALKVVFLLVTATLPKAKQD